MGSDPILSVALKGECASARSSHLREAEPGDRTAWLVCQTHDAQEATIVGGSRRAVEDEQRAGHEVVLRGVHAAIRGDRSVLLHLRLIRTSRVEAQLHRKRPWRRRAGSQI